MIEEIVTKEQFRLYLTVQENEKKLKEHQIKYFASSIWPLNAATAVFCVGVEVVNQIIDPGVDFSTFFFGVMAYLNIYYAYHGPRKVKAVSRAINDLERELETLKSEPAYKSLIHFSSNPTGQ